MSKQRTFKKNGVKYSIVDNDNYNKDFSCVENSCKKYLLMMFSERYNAWISTGKYGDTIAMIREEVAD